MNRALTGHVDRTDDTPPSDSPAEHRRFAGHLRRLRRVGEAEEIGCLVEVLADPDPTMARSAVLRHVDRRAAELYRGGAFATWAEAVGRACAGHPVVLRRLREWILFRSAALDGAWRADALAEASDWLQYKVAAESGTADALEFLAVQGRTRRIRHAAAAALRLVPDRPR
ncbi:hypothetical protein [Streptomyces sp. NPDC093225]|uniref:hypothetical protein n=1 Tax=Streptomyces sp. NPDC093225 TaxID=3366034 RepID=UPI0037F5AA97